MAYVYSVGELLDLAHSPLIVVPEAIRQIDPALFQSVQRVPGGQHSKEHKNRKNDRHLKKAQWDMTGMELANEQPKAPPPKPAEEPASSPVVPQRKQIDLWEGDYAFQSKNSGSSSRFSSLFGQSQQPNSPSPAPPGAATAPVQAAVTGLGSIESLHSALPSISTLQSTPQSRLSMYGYQQSPHQNSSSLAGTAATPERGEAALQTPLRGPKPGVPGSVLQSGSRPVSGNAQGAPVPMPPGFPPFGHQIPPHTAPQHEGRHPGAPAPSNNDLAFFNSLLSRSTVPGGATKSTPAAGQQATQKPTQPQSMQSSQLGPFGGSPMPHGPYGARGMPQYPFSYPQQPPYGMANKSQTPHAQGQPPFQPQAQIYSPKGELLPPPGVQWTQSPR